MKTINGLHITTINSKLGYIQSFDIHTPEICEKMPCYKKCYAQKITRIYKHACEAYTRNYEMIRDNIPFFIDELNSYLKYTRPLFFRWHSDGELFNLEYLKAILSIAENNPEINFLLFTKRYDLLRQIDVCTIPKNLSIIVSLWQGLKTPIDLRLNYSFSYCIEKGQQLPESALLCPGHCSTCSACWSLAKHHLDVAFYRH